MHVGRDDKKPEYGVCARGQANIGMIEQGTSIEQYFENYHGDCRRTEQENDCQFDEHGQYYFNGMESNSGARIYVCVNVMHAVNTPEQALFVEGDMLPIYGHVEKEDANDHQQPVGKREKTEQAEIVCFAIKSQAGRDDRNEYANQYCRKYGNGDIGKPSLCLGDIKGAAGPQGLGSSHDHKHGDE